MNICKVFINKDGIKYYLLEENLMPIYIKEGDYNNCNYLINNYDSIEEVNGYDLRKIREALLNNIHNTKKLLKNHKKEV
jgi:hypothetical protein